MNKYRLFSSTSQIIGYALLVLFLSQVITQYIFSGPWFFFLSVSGVWIGGGLAIVGIIFGIVGFVGVFFRKNTKRDRIKGLTAYTLLILVSCIVGYMNTVPIVNEYIEQNRIANQLKEADPERKKEIEAGFNTYAEVKKEIDRCNIQSVTWLTLTTTGGKGEGDRYLQIELRTHRPEITETYLNPPLSLAYSERQRLHADIITSNDTCTESVEWNPEITF